MAIPVRADPLVSARWMSVGVYLISKLCLGSCEPRLIRAASRLLLVLRHGSAVLDIADLVEDEGSGGVTFWE